MPKQTTQPDKPGKVTFTVVNHVDAAGRPRTQIRNLMVDGKPVKRTGCAASLERKSS